MAAVADDCSVAIVAVAIAVAAEQLPQYWVKRAMCHELDLMLAKQLVGLLRANDVLKFVNLWGQVAVLAALMNYVAAAVAEHH